MHDVGIMFLVILGLILGTIVYEGMNKNAFMEDCMRIKPKHECMLEWRQ